MQTEGDYTMLEIKWRHGQLGSYRYVEGKNLSKAMDREEKYALGYIRARFPVPAIPLKVHLWEDAYPLVVYIDNVQDEEDPIMVCFWDFWPYPDMDWPQRGTYTRVT